MNIFKKNKMRTILESDLLVYSPVKNGKSMKLSKLRDGVFSLQGLGDGISIDVKEDKVDIFAPIDGLLQVVYPHGNCFGIRTKCGSKMLIHIGTEHKHLDKEYSKTYIEQGAQIKRGDKIATIDMKYMKDNTTITSIEQIIVVIPSRDEIINKWKGKLDLETNIFSIRKESK